MIKRRSTPRRGRYIDREYLAWIHGQPSVVPTHDPKCRRFNCWMTAHHVKSAPGAPKDDRRALPLFACRHLIQHGDETVEHGKDAFEARFKVDFEREILRLNLEYGRSEAAA